MDERRDRQVDAVVSAVTERHGGQVVAVLATAPEDYGLVSAGGDAIPSLTLLHLRPVRGYLTLSDGSDRWRQRVAELDVEVWEVRRLLRRLIRSDPDVWRLVNSPVLWGDAPGREGALMRIRQCFTDYADPYRILEHCYAQAKKDVSVFFQDPLAVGGEGSGWRVKYPRLVASLAAGVWIARSGEVPPVSLGSLLDPSNAVGPTGAAAGDFQRIQAATAPLSKRSTALDAWINDSFAVLRHTLEDWDQRRDGDHGARHTDPVAEVEALFQDLVLAQPVGERR